VVGLSQAFEYAVWPMMRVLTRGLAHVGLQGWHDALT
jgi:hypothetical protein